MVGGEEPQNMHASKSAEGVVEEKKCSSPVSPHKIKLGAQSQATSVVYGGESTVHGVKNIQNNNEVIHFAGFLSDYDPSLIFVLSYDKECNVSYLKVLKIERREEAVQRSVSFAEKTGKDTLI